MLILCLPGCTTLELLFASPEPGATRRRTSRSLCEPKKTCKHPDLKPYYPSNSKKTLGLFHLYFYQQSRFVQPLRHRWRTLTPRSSALFLTFRPWNHLPIRGQKLFALTTMTDWAAAQYESRQVEVLVLLHLLGLRNGRCWHRLYSTAGPENSH